MRLLKFTFKFSFVIPGYASQILSVYILQECTHGRFVGNLANFFRLDALTYNLTVMVIVESRCCEQ